MIRLVGRVCKDLLAPDERVFCRLTVSELKRRLLTTRLQRIAAWKIWAAARCGSFITDNICAMQVRTERDL